MVDFSHFKFGRKVDLWVQVPSLDKSQQTFAIFIFAWQLGPGWHPLWQLASNHKQNIIKMLLMRRMPDECEMDGSLRQLILSSFWLEGFSVSEVILCLALALQQSQKQNK